MGERDKVGSNGVLRAAPRVNRPTKGPWDIHDQYISVPRNTLRFVQETE